MCKSKFFTLPLYWVAALRDDIPSAHCSLCSTLSSAMLNMHRWLRDPLPKNFVSRAHRRWRKISRLFFSAYETNVWHSTEHCSAVDLSVNRQQYARACWQLIWHWPPRHFKTKEKLYTSPLLLLFFWGILDILCWCIPSLVCNQLIVDLKMSHVWSTCVVALTNDQNKPNYVAHPHTKFRGCGFAVCVWNTGHVELCFLHVLTEIDACRLITADVHEFD